MKTVPTRAALVVLAATSFQVAARAQSGLDGALVRAREGQPLQASDRQLAADLLREWRASEEVAPGTGDPSLGRALEAMAAGRAVSSRDAAALRRHGEACRRDRVEHADALQGPSRGAPPSGRAAPAESGRRLRRDLARYWLVVAAGLVVVAVGAAWIVLARALRGRQR